PVRAAACFTSITPTADRHSTLSLHDALPIWGRDFESAMSLEYLQNLNRRYEEWIESYDLGKVLTIDANDLDFVERVEDFAVVARDRKSTRLNSSHVKISYAVFCLKKKNRTGGSLYIIHGEKNRNMPLKNFTEKKMCCQKRRRERMVSWPVLVWIVHGRKLECAACQ